MKNGGLDSEEEYNYTAIDGTCWLAAEKRHVANIANYSDVATMDENQLSAAVLKQPVSVAIEADQAAFQHYKSGVFDAPCGVKLDHGVLIVGLTSDAYIVKNSWGATWGDHGYIMMKRNIVNASGICGIAMQPSYPLVPKQAPSPIPPPTPGPRPPPPQACPSCTPQKISMCGAFGMKCCCGQNGTVCHSSTKCCCNSTVSSECS